MSQIIGIDHVAITVSDIEAACAFYERLFGAQTKIDYAPRGKSLVRQIALGGALLSVHQAGNGIGLVAKQPTVGSADICFRWRGTIAEAESMLRKQGVEVIAGPVPRHTADGLPSQSVYFHDLDSNLLELMTSD
jgi:catechol 2,3-dioxygenase-like lactoylglutathione lyase family enzyme